MIIQVLLTSIRNVPVRIAAKYMVFIKNEIGHYLVHI